MDETKKKWHWNEDRAKAFAQGAKREPVNVYKVLSGFFKPSVDEQTKKPSQASDKPQGQ